MSMTPREWILAVFNGEEPDKTPVCTYASFLRGSTDWAQRLQKRGLGVISSTAVSKPPMCLPYFWQRDSHRTDVKHVINTYLEKGISKYRGRWETPVGSITGVGAHNPQDYSDFVTVLAPEEYPVKEPPDWRVVNFFIKDALDNLEPNYQEFERTEKDIGDQQEAL